MNKQAQRAHDQAENFLEPRLEDGKVAEHALCVHCGYDLFGHDADGHCSECGRTVKLTLRFNQRKPSDHWLPNAFNACVVAILLIGFLLTAFRLTGSDTWETVLSVLSWMLVGWNGALVMYAVHRADRTAMLAWHGTALISITSIVITLTLLMLRIRFN
jgi:ribosomal protein L37E